MAIDLDLITSVLVGLFGAVTAVIFVRGMVGLFARHDHQSHWHS